MIELVEGKNMSSDVIPINSSQRCSEKIDLKNDNKNILELKEYNRFLSKMIAFHKTKWIKANQNQGLYKVE